ncbi:MAG: ribose-phosphate pyrophosphokinase [Ignavibacteria bacterium]|jgi:ribose-phosphate pyrophosphokinase
MSNEPLIFAGSSSSGFADKISKYLNIELGKVALKRFSDGEIWVKYMQNIRGRDVHIIQSTMPPAENLMELLILIDAARRSSAKRVTAVIPYFGYARQDRKDQPRVAITAKLVANLITQAGADRVITMDLHAAQIQGFFDIPFDHLYASRIFTNLFENINPESLVVVSPDVGGIKLARSYAKRLNAGLAILDKNRPEPNIAEIMNIIGNVYNKDVLLVDDLIDTGGTFVAAVEALKKQGAKKVYGVATHPLFSSSAIEKIENSSIDKLYVTDSIPLNNLDNYTKISVQTASELFAEAILRSFNNESISSLFDINKD